MTDPVDDATPRPAPADELGRVGDAMRSLGWTPGAKRPSVRAIRGALGGGSFSTLGPLVQRVVDEAMLERGEATPGSLTAILLDASVRVMSELRQEASRLAALDVAEADAAAEARVRLAEERATKAGAREERQVREREHERGRADALASRIAGLEDDIRDVRGERDGYRTELERRDVLLERTGTELREVSARQSEDARSLATAREALNAAETERARLADALAEADATRESARAAAAADRDTAEQARLLAEERASVAARERDTLEIRLEGLERARERALAAARDADTRLVDAQGRHAETLARLSPVLERLEAALERRSGSEEGGGADANPASAPDER